MGGEVAGILFFLFLGMSDIACDDLSVHEKRNICLHSFEEDYLVSSVVGGTLDLF